ncbi:LOW QUALITY PROTEIN: LSU ribosomal protein L7/L12 (P1/P2) [Psychrobacter sp. JCM 18901]|nr:LOW QUALITY PROTEIN: LSU ribosomal protein L7/L12 (P1/P2) [Psychrobacter sp. JCM 18900]GAF56856.1 LOW QUALITY PROTEIN: LSU ribosomal protein L7/L12 (P1/P2) [Psychrobacter sp. JCM 18901]
MALSKDDVLNAIAEMSVMDIVELISDMEEKFGVTAAVAAAPAAAGPAAAAAEEKDEFDVVLASFGEKKLALKPYVKLLVLAKKRKIWLKALQLQSKKAHLKLKLKSKRNLKKLGATVELK